MFEIQQVFTDPRTGGEFVTAFETHETLTAAKASVRKHKLKRWVIVQTKIVARSVG